MKKIILAVITILGMIALFIFYTRKPDNSLFLHHNNALVSVEWNDDDTKLISWVHGGTIAIWDTKSGERLHTLNHHNPVIGAFWNEDGTLILSWTEDKNVWVWDAETGKVLYKLPHLEMVNGIGGYQELLTSASGDKIITVWDITTRKELYKIDINSIEPELETRIKLISFNADGSKIITLAENGMVAIWNASTGDLDYKEMPNSGSRQIIAGHNNLFASWLNNNTIQIKDATNGKTLVEIPVDILLFGIYWDYGTDLLYGFSREGDLGIWNVTTGEAIFETHLPNNLNGLAIDHEHNLLLCIGRHGELATFDIITGDQRLQLELGKTIYSIDLNERDQIVLVGTIDGMQQIDLKSGEREEIQTIDDVEGVRWSHDNNSAVIWSESGDINIINYDK